MPKKKAGPDPEEINRYREKQCEICPLGDCWDDLNNPLMEPTGVDGPEIMILGEAPSQSDDRKAGHFSDRAGQTIRELIPRKYRDKILFDNTIRCHPHGNRKPSWEETESCRPFILDDILHFKPKVIIAVGGYVLNWFTSGQNITPWSGKKFPYRVWSYPDKEEFHDVWVFPVLHPASTLYSPEVYSALEEHMRNIFKDIPDLPEPQPYDTDKIFDNVKCLTKGSEFEIDYISEVFSQFANHEYVAVDIETNALRPYEEGAKILSIAIGTEELTISIPLHHKETPWTPSQLKLVEQRVKDFLYQEKPNKIAHSAGFELEWFGHFYGKEIVRASQWDDTLAQAYLLDTRKGGNSLDSLCLQHFGFNLKEYSPTDVKNLDEEPLEDVLRYNAGDTRFTEKLFYVQQELLDQDGIEPHVYQDQIDRVPTLVLAQLYGMDVDYDAINEIEEKVESHIRESEHALKKLKVVKDYEEIHGKFNPNSPQQVICILRDFVKTDKCKRGNKYSSDEKTLQQIDHKFAKRMLEYREYSTLKKMFVKPISPNYGADAIFPDNKLHTQYTSTFARTRRLSSRSINLQQMPSRSSRWVRSYIVPPEDHVILAVDYGAIEARVIAAQSQDQYLIDALWDRYDIHREWALRLYKEHPDFFPGDIEDKKQMSLLRYRGKNEFVFPSFYGADHKACSYYLGIPERKVRRVQDEFWSTFEGVKKWQEETLDCYQENRYIVSPTGFKYRAPMSINDLYNHPTQGTASDIVVDAMNRLSKYAEETEQPQFQARINVHDDLTFCIPLDTLEEDCDTIFKFMLDVPFNFMQVVPILVEAKIGDNWDEMEEVGEFSSDKYLGKTRKSS